MALPSLADVVMVIVLLLPGFISLVLFKWISIVEKKLSDSETVIWSLFISLLIYTVFSATTGISDVDSIRDGIFLPINLITIMSLSLIFGSLPGILVRYCFRKRIVRGDCWDVCMARAKSKKHFWVIVYTKDGLEYKGRLHIYGTKGEHPRELVIEDPKLIQKSEGKVPKEIKMGSEILFLQEDIRRIVFLQDLRKS